MFALAIEYGLYVRKRRKRPACRKQAERCREDEGKLPEHYITTLEREPSNQCTGAAQKVGRRAINTAGGQIRVDGSEPAGYLAVGPAMDHRCLRARRTRIRH